MSVLRAVATILALASLSGCGFFRRGAEDIPLGAIPQPVGSFQNTWQDAQAHKAEAADFVFYTYEWHEGTPRLNAYGLRHLSDLLPRLGFEPFNIVVQPGREGADLDEERRAALVAQLEQHEVQDPAERVLLASVPEGLYGDESILIRQAYPFGGSSANEASAARSRAGTVDRGSVGSAR